MSSCIVPFGNKRHQLTETVKPSISSDRWWHAFKDATRVYISTGFEFNVSVVFQLNEGLKWSIARKVYATYPTPPWNFSLAKRRNSNVVNYYAYSRFVLGMLACSDNALKSVAFTLWQTSKIRQCWESYAVLMLQLGMGQLRAILMDMTVNVLLC